MELTFEECTLSDLDKLKEITISTFTSTYGKDNTPENLQKYLDESFGETALIEQLQNEFSEFYFANIGDRTIGYLKLNMGDAQTEMRDSLAIEIERIYVIREYQGNGFGNMFLSAVVDLAKSRNLKYIWLGVWKKNPKAVGFYENFGFKKFKDHNFLLGDEHQTDYLMKFVL